MDIRLEQYKTFFAAAQAGSFSEAASRLFITQSAVSQQIRLLEEALGVTLFVREKKGARLTGHGELLFSYVSRFMNEIESAESLFSKMRSLEEGSLRIGAGDTLTRHFLLSRLAEFHGKYPNIKIEIVNRVTSETLSKLSLGRLDLAFVNLPVEKEWERSLEIHSIGSLQDVFVGGSKYRHLENKVLTLSDIASLPLVMLEPKSNTRKTVDAFCRERGITLSPEFELGSHDLLFDFARENLGIACVTSEFATPRDFEGLFLLKTDFSLPKRSIGVCRLTNVSPTPAIARLLEMIEA